MAVLHTKRADGAIIEWDEATRTITCARRKSTFTKSEWKLLTMLYDAAGETVTRDDLIEAIWGDRDKSETRIVDVHVSSIRKKLRYLEIARISSVYGKGYKLIPTKKL
jgi:DNA-binding response OmpR family regulator